jgi:hypothetical protein
MENINLVEENLPKVQNESTQNACHLRKPHGMTSSQKASAVRRKRAAGNPGGKPTNVATFAKRKKMGMGGMV